MIEIKLTGSNEASSCGISMSGRGMGSPLCKLARRLIDDGYAAHDIALIKRGETLCFTPAMLSFWAERDVTEGMDYSARFTKHKPMSSEVWGAQ